MEDSNKITKGQLLEMIRKEIVFQEKKELLESKILRINDELYTLTEGREGKKKKEDDIDEGLFQNIGRGIGKMFGGTQQVGQAATQKVQQAGQAVAKKVQQAGQAVATKYQSGADTKSLQYAISDIKEKQAELADAKKKYQNLTGKAYNEKGALKATVLPRSQQGVVKTKKAAATATPTTATATTTPAPIQNAPAQNQNPNQSKKPAMVGENKKK